MAAASRLREFGDLVSLAYEGIEDQRRWKSLMASLSRETGSRDAALLIASPSMPGMYYLVTDNEDPVATGRVHVDGVMSVNPLLELPQPQPISVDELMPDGGFLRSTLYRRFLQPLNIRYLLSCDVLRSELVCAVLALERNADQPPFTTREKDLLALIAPHMARAIRLREQHARGGYMLRFFEEAMAKLSIACVVLDARGQVASMNERARELLTDPHLLSVRTGRLRTGDAIDGRALTRAIDLALAAHRNRCSSQRGVGLQLGTGKGAGVFDIVVRPLVADQMLESGEQPAVIVYINDSRQSAICLDPAVLSGMYGPTRCEGQVASLLARGLSLDEVADALDVSINTVKTHLRGIYDKMGTNRQSQILARLNHSTARLL